MGYIQSAKSDGVTVHCGGEQEGTNGFYIKPTLFTGVDADMKIMKEEIFGPVGAVVKFENEDGIYIYIYSLFSSLNPTAFTKISSRRRTIQFMVLLLMFSARASPGLLKPRTS